MDKALELWKRLFEWWLDDPYKYEGGEYRECSFCGEFEPFSHKPNCIWIDAKKLVEENIE